MRIAETIERLKICEPLLRARGVRGLAIFGSAARGEDRPDSDVDLLVELDDTRSVSLFDLSELKFLASEALGRPADIAIRGQLRAGYRASIESDAIPVFCWALPVRRPLP